MKLDPGQLERVAALFRAFAESTRLAIIQELKGGELSVSEIVARLTTSQANVSKQLKLLHDAGLVSRRKHGTQVLYQTRRSDGGRTLRAGLRQAEPRRDEARAR